MKCNKCGYFPCIKEVCNLNLGECNEGKSSISIFMKNDNKGEKYENTKLYSDRIL